MFDRLFMPALTFVVLCGVFAAFVVDMARSSPMPIVQLERVIISAQREIAPTPLARADTPTAAIVR